MIKNTGVAGPIKILHASSFDNIAIELMPLVDEVRKYLQEILGEKLFAIFGCGSWTRKEMKYGSDVDFFCVASSPITAEEKNAIISLRKTLVAKWCVESSPFLLSDVEIKFIDLKHFDDWHVIVRRVIIQIDGTLLAGKALDENVFEQYTLKHIVTAFIRWHLNFIELQDIQSTETSTRKRSRRNFVKIIIRCLRWLAVFRGSPVSCSIPKYIHYIENYIPEFKNETVKLYQIYKQEEISDEDVIFSQSFFNEILNTFQKEDISVIRPKVSEVNNFEF
jgi:predicted nucleotidyltransferase